MGPANEKLRKLRLKGSPPHPVFLSPPVPISGAHTVEPKSRNISNIHMFRLKILSKIQIQDYSRSIKVTRAQILVKMIE